MSNARFVTKQEAQAWFAAHAKDIVGTAGREASCPLANCVSSMIPGAHVVVSTDGISVGRLVQDEPWISRFVIAVDQLGGGTQVAGVTASALLASQV